MKAFYSLPLTAKKKDSKCKLHIALHGWNGGGVGFAEEIQNILHYAASNDIIVIWPFAWIDWFTSQKQEDGPAWTKLHTKDAI